MKRLSAVLSRAGLVPDAGEGDVLIAGISADSRQVQAGLLYIAMPSFTGDGHRYLEDAAAAGASAALVHSAEGLSAARSLGLAAILVEAGVETIARRARLNEFVCRLCNEFYDRPTRSMKVVGVTGTNGKTSVAWFLRDLLGGLGYRAAYLGTLGFHLDNERRELPNTTPYPAEFYAMMAEARDRGVGALAMEVSSHALAERRIEGVEFDAAIFTNLSQDHLDLHGTMEEYEAAKRRLFIDFPAQTGKRFTPVINTGDPVGARWFSDLGGLSFSVAEGSTADVRAENPLVEVDRIQANFIDQTDRLAVNAPLGGAYNLENLLAAAAALKAVGHGLSELQPALAKLRPVPGRFEPVPNDREIGIIVDYAHTPDALRSLLATAKDLTRGRVTIVFGCGGDRDRGKRPLMGAAAVAGADRVIVTSDNPRTENPCLIIEEILAGVPTGSPVRAIEDRAEAIAEAVRQAAPGDTVVIAGKGHEHYQIIGRTKFPMDDRELARRAL